MYNEFIVKLLQFVEILKHNYSKTCVKRPLSKRLKMVFQDRLLLDAGQKYYRMLQRGHSAIQSTFNKIPYFIRSLNCFDYFEWPFYTGFII